MNQNMSFCIDNSAKLLSSIFPGENWAWFLSKNLHGLTDGYPTIPFDNSSDSVAYDFKDLKNFALTYGNGSITEEQINQHATNYAQQFDLLYMLSEIDRSRMPTNSRTDNFLSENASEDRDYFSISSGEYWALTELLDEVLNTQEEVAQALVTLGTTFKVLGTEGTPTAEEIDAIKGLATSHAGRAYGAYEQLAMISQALADEHNYWQEKKIAAKKGGAQ